MQFNLVFDLLKHKADPNGTDPEGQTSLHCLMAIYSLNSEIASNICKILIEFGANPNKKNKNGWTPLHIAVRREQEEAINWIISYNSVNKNQFKINKKGGSEGWTPLHLAAYCGLKDICIMLCDSKANLFAINKENKIPKNYCESNFFLMKMFRYVFFLIFSSKFL